MDIFSEKTVGATAIKTLTRKTSLGKGTLRQHVSDRGKIVSGLIDERADINIKPLKQFFVNHLYVSLPEP